MINASDDEHEGIILGKPFLKLVNVVLDVGKGIVTFDLDGEKRSFEFHSKPLGKGILSNALWRMKTLKMIKTKN